MHVACSETGSKTKHERCKLPMFHTAVEMHSHEEWYVYTDVTRSVDVLLAGEAASVQLRRHLDGKMLVSNQQTASQESSPNKLGAMFGLVGLTTCCMPVKLHVPTDDIGLCDK